MPKFFSVLLIAVLLSGCASKYGTPHTDVHYYGNCYRPISKLRQEEFSVAKGTGAGALIGAIGGALLGFLATGSARGAVVSGAMGAATGAVMGNMYARNQKELDENRRMYKYMHDIEGDIEQLDIVSASAEASLKCYNDAFQRLVADIRTKRVLRREAERRFNEIAQGRDEAIELLGRAITYGHDLDAEYERAFEQEEYAQKKKSKSVNPGLKTAREHKRRISEQVDAMNKKKTMAQKESRAHEEEFDKRLEEIDI